MYDIVIKGGLVVDQGVIRCVDIAVVDGKVAEVAPGLVGKTRREINAAGRYLFPGIIDVHTHPVYLDDLQGTSEAAAHGGITTLVHYAYAKPGTKLMDAIAQFRKEGEAGSVIDFALHGGLFDPEHQSEEIPEAVQAGVTSFKMFMTYAKLKWMSDDYQLMWRYGDGSRGERAGNGLPSGQVLAVRAESQGSICRHQAGDSGSRGSKSGDRDGPSCWLPAVHRSPYRAGGC